MQEKNLNMPFKPSEQTRLYFYEKYFSLFTDLYEKNLLPNQILLSGNSGIGKSTFAYHFVNYVLSKNELNPYDSKNFRINYLNKSTIGDINLKIKDIINKLQKYNPIHASDIKEIMQLIRISELNEFDEIRRNILNTISNEIKTIAEVLTREYNPAILDDKSRKKATLICQEYNIVKLYSLMRHCWMYPMRRKWRKHPNHSR